MIHKSRTIGLALLFLFCHVVGMAQTVVSDTLSAPADSTQTDSACTDSVVGMEGVFNAFDKIIDRAPVIEQILIDSLSTEKQEFSDMSRRKQLRQLKKFFSDQFTEWNNIDTTYITPQLYDYAVMLQTTTSFENFTLKGAEGDKQTLQFAPKPGFRLGGYFGWRWIFWGYNVDLNGLFGEKKDNKKKLSFDFSFYTSKVGVDLYYRRTGNDFKIKNLNSIFNDEVPRPEGLSDNFNALDLNTRGFNVYYIFNHRRFSYPAAFSQSTMQRRSAGTFKLGFSFTHHKVKMNIDKIDDQLIHYIQPSLLFNTVKYNDYSVNFGYAYNWVFAKNWLFSISLSPGLAYNVAYYNADNIASGSTTEEDTRFRHFSFDKLNLDFITRMGLVYNDNKHFFGVAFRFHSFDYRNRQINMNNSFGYLHFYAGFNFKKRKGMWK